MVSVWLCLRTQQKGHPYDEPTGNAAKGQVGVDRDVRVGKGMFNRARFGSCRVRERHVRPGEGQPNPGVREAAAYRGGPGEGGTLRPRPAPDTPPSRGARRAGLCPSGNGASVSAGPSWGGGRSWDRAGALQRCVQAAHPGSGRFLGREPGGFLPSGGGAVSDLPELATTRPARAVPSAAKAPEPRGAGIGQ